MVMFYRYPLIVFANTYIFIKFAGLFLSESIINKIK